MVEQCGKYREEKKTPNPFYRNWDWSSAKSREKQEITQKEDNENQIDEPSEFARNNFDPKGQPIYQINKNGQEHQSDTGEEKKDNRNGRPQYKEAEHLLLLTGREEAEDSVCKQVEDEDDGCPYQQSVKSQRGFPVF